jgi:hypothetical protein
VSMSSSRVVSMIDLLIVWSKQRANGRLGAALTHD